VVYCNPTTPPAISGWTNGQGYSFYHSFKNNADDFVIYVPYQEYASYKNQSGNSRSASPSNWYKFRSYIKAYDFENSIEVEM
jgi:hypothetical protein